MIQNYTYLDELHAVPDVALILFIMGSECRDPPHQFSIHGVWHDPLNGYHNRLLHFVADDPSNLGRSLSGLFSHDSLHFLEAFESLGSPHSRTARQRVLAQDRLDPSNIPLGVANPHHVFDPTGR